MDVTANNGGSVVIMGEWKLFVNNPRTGTLTDPYGSTYALGQTQDTIYIYQPGNYTLDVTNNDQKAIVAKTVGTISTPPDVNKALYTIFKLGPTSGINVNDGWQRSVNYIGVNGVNILSDGSHQTGYLYTWNQRSNTSFVQSTGIGMNA